VTDNEGKPLSARTYVIKDALRDQLTRALEQEDFKWNTRRS
jgi:hypothetical protein